MGPLAGGIEGYAAHEEIAFLSRSAMSFVELAPDANIHPHIAEHLRELAPDAYLFVHSYDPASHCLIPRASAGISPAIEKTITILGVRPLEARYPVAEDALSGMLSGKLTVVPGGLYNLAMGAIPRPMCLALERLLGIGEIHAMGFARGGELFGNVVIIGRARSPLRNPGLVEAYVNQAAVALQHRHAEDLLRESEARYRFLAEHATDVIWTADLDLRITYVTPSIEQTAGYAPEEVIGRLADEVLAPESLRAARARLADWLALPAHDPTTGDRTFEMEVCRKDGGSVVVETRTRLLRDADGKPSGLLGVCRDITERRQLEEQVRQAQKMESLGLLAGGITHDFNNLLTAVIANCGLAVEALPQGSPSRQRLRDAEAAASRAAELAGQMLDYSGRGGVAAESLDLSGVVRETAHLLQASLSKKAALHCDLPTGLPAMRGNVAQVRQVIMNFVINASEAVGDRNGTITGVRDADRATLADSYVDDHLPAGRYLFLEVADTGCGMSAETLAKVFDPFFTTKRAGRGLGLAAVLGIVRGHRGALRVSSRPGEGTVFRVLFPALHAPSPSAPAHQQPPAAPAWKGSGTVLVVDDEAPVRAVAGTILRAKGFQVLDAADGREGIATFHAHRAEIANVLLDLTMPGLGGEEVLRQIRQVAPSLPVILTSGYTDPESLSGIDTDPHTRFLSKPYRVADLVGLLRECLPSGG